MSDGSSKQLPELARFFTTAAIGLIIDISIASALIILWQFGDITAAGIGLFAGMVFNYFVHSNWTFKENQRSASVGHFLEYSVGVALTMLVRAAVLWAISAYGFQEILPAPIRLGIGAVFSFVFSYLICRHLIFRTPSVNHRNGQ